MAKKTIADKQADKQRKQKKLLLLLAPVLLALVAIQGPKLLGGSDTSAAADTTATGTTDGTATPAAGTPSTTIPASVPVTGPKTVLIGVPVGTGTPAKPGDGQLASFSLFKAHDPFVQFGKAAAAAAGNGGASTSPAPKPGALPPSGGDPGTGILTPTVSGEGPSTAGFAYATILVNGVEEALQVKQPFPTDDPTFVLVALAKKQARLGIAGGRLTKGKTVLVALNKPLTLVNTATGARYRITLVYTGAAPEEKAEFDTTAATAK
jgi:hypothetical protein